MLAFRIIELLEANGHSDVANILRNKIENPVGYRFVAGGDCSTCAFRPDATCRAKYECRGNERRDRQSGCFQVDE